MNMRFILYKQCIICIVFLMKMRLFDTNNHSLTPTVFILMNSTVPILLFYKKRKLHVNFLKQT